MTYSTKINQVNHQQVKQGLQPAFEKMFEDLIAGGKSAGQVFSDLMGSVAKLLAQLVARVLVRALFGGIFGDDGTMPNRTFGGAVPNNAVAIWHERIWDIYPSL